MAILQSLGLLVHVDTFMCGSVHRHGSCNQTIIFISAFVSVDFAFGTAVIQIPVVLRFLSPGERRLMTMSYSI
jgi:hypothetical protein